MKKILNHKAITTKQLVYVIGILLLISILIAPISYAEDTLRQVSVGLKHKTDYDTYSSPSERTSKISLVVTITDGDPSLLTDSAKKVHATLNWGEIGIIATAVVVHKSGYVDDKGNYVFTYIDAAAGGATGKAGPTHVYKMGHKIIKTKAKLKIEDRMFIRRLLRTITFKKTVYIKASSSVTAEAKLEFTIEGFGGGVKFEQTVEQGEYFAITAKISLPFGQAYEFCDAKATYMEYINGHLTDQSTKELHSLAVINGIVYESWG